MKAVERKSLWHHTVFSGLLCAVMAVIVITRRDLPSAFLAGLVVVYVTGNSYLHYRRKDFHKETLLEYLLISAAVIIVLLGAIGN